jgi:hypothetical protein
MPPLIHAPSLAGLFLRTYEQSEIFAAIGMSCTPELVRCRSMWCTGLVVYTQATGCVSECAVSP